MYRFKFYLVIFLFVLQSSSVVVGQSDFAQIEKNLAYHCDVMVNAFESRHRMMAMEQFNQKFMDVLVDKNSYDFPFDSLKWISKKSPADNSFRIFTWEVKVSDDEYKYFGVLQKPNSQFFILKDDFKNAEGLANEEFSSENWLGSVYYNLMEAKDVKGEKYFLLFGVNKWNNYENVKLVDVLFFSKGGIPYFGKPVFKSSEKDQPDQFTNRLVFKYAADGKMTLNYNPGMEMIVVDNLIKRMSRIPGQGETLVPDGSYIGYSLENNYWTRINKIATQVMDSAPRPKPILDGRKGKKIFGN